MTIFHCTTPFHRVVKINYKYRKLLKQTKASLVRGNDYTPPAQEQWVESKPKKTNPESERNKE